MSRARASLARAWPHLRAAFVLYHLAAIAVSAAPSPGQGLRRELWSDPTVQAEFAAWSGRLGVGSEALQDIAFDLASHAHAARRVALVPFDPYLRGAGTRQSWKMFVAPHRFPSRLSIDARVAGAWVPLFQERSATATWNARALSSERVRSQIFQWSWPTYRRRWKQACLAFGRAALDEDPAREAIRCRLYKARSPTPGQVASSAIPAGTFTSTITVTRDDLVPPAP